MSIDKMPDLLSLPVEIICGIVRHLTHTNDLKPCPTPLAMNVAFTCKKLNQIALPILYEEIAVNARPTCNQGLLCYLLYHLIKYASLADSVKYLDLTQHQFENDDVFKWDYPKDFRNVRDRWLKRSNFRPNFANAWEQDLGEYKHDIAQKTLSMAFACRNLVDLRFPVIEDRSLHWEDPYLKLFSNDNWPWQNLQDIYIDGGQNTDSGNNGFRLLRQLFEALSISGRSLRSLRFDAWCEAAFDWSSCRMHRPVQLSMLDIRRTGRWIPEYNILDDPHQILVACANVESFYMIVVYPQWYLKGQQRGPQLEHLQLHKSHLRVIKLKGQIRFTYNDLFIDPDENDTRLPSPDKALNLSDFSVLEELHIEMPLLFDPAFFSYEFNSPISDDREIWVLKNPTKDQIERMQHLYIEKNRDKIPATGFSTLFRNVLVDNLPPSLRLLRVVSKDAYQDQALAQALAGIFDQRDSALPSLDRIYVYTTCAEAYEELPNLTVLMWHKPIEYLNALRDRPLLTEPGPAIFLEVGQDYISRKLRFDEAQT